jgi:hypothetical protein
MHRDGFRRTHEEAAVAAARAAHGPASPPPRISRGKEAILGPDHRHQRARLHPGPRAAERRRSPHRWRAWASRPPCSSTLATSWRVFGRVEIAGTELGAVRLDSGDLSSRRPTRSEHCWMRLRCGQHPNRRETSDLDEIRSRRWRPLRRCLRRRHRPRDRKRCTHRRPGVQTRRQVLRRPAGGAVPVVKRSEGKVNRGGRKWLCAQEMGRDRSSRADRGGRSRSAGDRERRRRVSPSW